MTTRTTKAISSFIYGGLMNLERELKAKIDAIKEEDWQRELLAIPFEKSTYFEQARIVLYVDGETALSMEPFIGLVNATDFAGKAPEKILIGSCGMDSSGPYFVFHVRRDHPWTHFPGRDGIFRRVLDAKGEPIHAPVDFNLLSNTPRP
jgi:hypothetical protein